MVASAASELQHGPQAEHRRILENLAGLVRAERIGRAPARMGDVLEIRLQREFAPDFVLINGGDDPSEDRVGQVAPYRRWKSTSSACRPRRDAGVAAGDAELVLGATFVEADEFDPRVRVDVDDVAVRRAVGCPREDPMPRSSSCPTR